MNRVRALLALGALMVLPTLARPASDGRRIQALNPGWRFLGSDEPRAPQPFFDDRNWQPVNLPHTWNAVDGEDGGDNYRRGPGWYRRHLAVDASLAGKRLYLQFDGASLMADVYVNGIHLGTHRGGFARFRFDATEALKVGADNVIAVRVDNSKLGFAPTSADFTFFGGLYRDVALLATDPVQVSAMDCGSSGVFVDQQRVSAESADLFVRTELENHETGAKEVEVAFKVMDRVSGQATGAEQFVEVRLDPGARTEVAKALTVARPHLWNGRADPHLYTVRVEIRPLGARGERGAVCDAVEQPLGLRSFSVDADRGFELNGRYQNLYGFNRHQDWPDRGWVIKADQEAEDMGLIVDIGATAVRTSHYQQSETWYDLCDRSGIVAWTEIPFVNQALDTPEFLENAKQQLRELIRQNYNHPSICFWGVGNETSGEASDRVIAALAAVVKEEDPGRLSTYASHHDNADPRNWHTDVVGFNRYHGWYHGSLPEFAAWLDKTRADYPKARFALSEYGAGASILQHAENPAKPEARGPFHPEEYQGLYHEAYWAALKSRPYVWAKFIWCLHDFASDGRNEGDHPGRNDKGLVTYDRRTKKDAYFFYKANWSRDPVVHITGSRFDPRSVAVTDVKVYSNAPDVELEVNGVPLGSRSDAAGDRIFIWHGVTLAPGVNSVVAKAHFGTISATDSCTWHVVDR